MIKNCWIKLEIKMKKKSKLIFQLLDLTKLLLKNSKAIKAFKLFRSKKL